MWAVCGFRRLLTFVLPLYLCHIYKLINLIKLLLIKKCRYGISVYESIESHNVLNAIADFPGSAEPGCQFFLTYRLKKSSNPFKIFCEIFPVTLLRHMQFLALKPKNYI